MAAVTRVNSLSQVTRHIPDNRGGHRDAGDYRIRARETRGENSVTISLGRDRERDQEESTEGNEKITLSSLPCNSLVALDTSVR